MELMSGHGARTSKENGTSCDGTAHVSVLTVLSKYAKRTWGNAMQAAPSVARSTACCREHAELAGTSCQALVE